MIEVNQNVRGLIQRTRKVKHGPGGHHRERPTGVAIQPAQQGAGRQLGKVREAAR